MSATNPTPQSTKKIEEDLTKLVRTISGDDNAKFHPQGYTKQLLTILKETLEEALPDKKMITKYEGKRQSLQQGWNNAIDQTKANLNKLIGEDNE